MWEWLNLCLLCACLPSLPLWSEVTSDTCGNKGGVHFFTLNFEYHNKKVQKPVSFKKNKKTFF